MDNLLWHYPKMDISWDDAKLFLAVAESGSFSAASVALGIAQPTISRRIKELEFQLGWALFHRGKRGTTLSEDGARLMEPARQMARWATELQSNIARREEAPEGRVRVTAPPGLCFDFLVDFCKWLKKPYPAIRIELLASTEHLDLARGDADLALRTKKPQGAELALLASLDIQAAAFATPEYASTLPSPCSMTEVDWISWCAPMEHVTPTPQLKAMIPDFAPSFSSDNYLIQQRACELGLGALILGDVKHPLLREMGLVRLQLKEPLPTNQMHLVSSKSMEHVPRIRAVANALLEQFAELTQGTGRL